MAIHLKIARTAKELNDVFNLRYQSYVIEDKKFGGYSFQSEHIYDRYDVVPEVANIVAYDEGVPVGTVRANLKSEIGLPSEELFDFSDYFEKLEIDAKKNDKEIKIASGSMFAILKDWQGRRNVTFALLKLVVGVYKNWGVTHVIATANHETASIYKHLGFEELADSIWIEKIENSIVPMAAPFEKMHQWAFGKLMRTSLNEFWLTHFSQHFERILLAPNEVLFKEGDKADYAYIVDEGWIAISREDRDGTELNLAILSRGELFGELALLDEEPRSGTARAENHTELIRFSRNEFFTSIENQQDIVKQLLNLFSQRIRRTDQLAMVMAFAPQDGRVDYALNSLRRSAIDDPKRPNTKVLKLGPLEIAKTAGVGEFEVREILEKEKLHGRIDYGNKIIRFFE